MKEFDLKGLKPQGLFDAAEKQKEIMESMGCKKENIKVVGFGVYFCDGEIMTEMNMYVDGFDKSEYEG